MEFASNTAKDVLSPMKNFYKEKVVFLTGGTGFLGQLYVEKLLRSDVKHIYMLGRGKKHKTAEDRLKETFAGPQFCKLVKHDKDFLNRLSIIEGDLGKPQLGISESDQNVLIENVEIVLHAAAEVRFDEKLYKLLMVNLRGTRELLNLAERIKKLEVVGYISTAYSNCVRSYVEEKFYDPPVDPDVMIKLGEMYSGDVKKMEQMEILTERIIAPWPNTYTYTKSLCEDLVRQYGQKFPICIIRPSVVISTHEDPIPGWCNNIYGLNGVLMACGLGVFRLVPVRREVINDIVCADFVINSTLAAIWVTNVDTKALRQTHQTNETQRPNTQIYHVCSSTDRPTRNAEIMDNMYDVCAKSPFKTMYWTHSRNAVVCPFMWKYLTIFYHVIPATVVDCIMHLRGKKQRIVPIYRKSQLFMVALRYFMQNEWIFNNANMRKVLDRMSPYDQDFFPSDIKRWKWSECTFNYMQGLKVFIANETLDDPEFAMRRYKRLKRMHYFVLTLYYGFHVVVFTSIANALGLFDYLINFSVDTVKFFQNPHGV